MKREMLIAGIICITVLGFALLFQLIRSSYYNKTNIIESNLSIIMSTPELSSNAQDYIKQHRKEYDHIVNMRKFSLKYLLRSFSDNTENGLKEYIMACICCDILQDKNPVKKRWSTGREWFDEYVKAN